MTKSRKQDCIYKPFTDSYNQDCIIIGDSDPSQGFKPVIQIHGQHMYYH
nr:hypothetical protein [Candidatus Njordarchaeota archaeon]